MLCPDGRSGIKDFLFLKRYFRTQRRYFVFFVILLGITTAFGLFIPWVLKDAIDSLRQAREPRLLAFFALSILGLSLGQGIFRYLARNGFFSLARRVEYELRKDFFAQIQRLPLSYLDQTNTGDLVSRATNDLSAVFLFFGPGLFHLLNTLFVYALALGYMLAIDPRLTLFALMPYPLLALATRAYGKVAQPGYHEIQQKLAGLASKAQENLSGIRVVKAYLQEEHQIAQFSEKCQDYLQQNVKVAKISALFHALFGAVGGTGLVIVLWLGGQGVIAGRLTLGELIAFSSYLALLLFPTIAFGWIISLYQRARAAMGRINEILALRGPREKTRDTEAGLDRTAVEFRNLSFSYPSPREDGAGPILEDINLTIPEGSTLGIVGLTGSGKSTLLYLIARLYPVEDGKLFLGGKDINSISPRKLRGQIGFVPQEPFLFSESLKENIAFGAIGVREEEIYQAAQLARLMRDVAELPEKLDTLVGERGITLSGGQRQRAALARAIMVDPKIFILDEAVASVDAQTEQEIRDGLAPFLKGRTCLIVSHRISSVKDADQIIVLDEGRIVERGTHQELLEKGGLYARLYKRQVLSEELARLE